jgi:hypothetical protein
MHEAQAILVIITSSVLVIFLLLAIVAMIFLLKTVKAVRRLLDKAEELVDSAEAVTEVFKNVKGPLAAAKLLRNIIALATKHK